jgi:hypothetical protein
MAQMDLFFDPPPEGPRSHFNWTQAMERCKNCSDGGQFDACCGVCKPKGEEFTTILPPYKKPY